LIERRDLRLARARAKPRLRRARVAALEQRRELVRADLTLQAQLAGTATEPLARCLATTAVVVIAALRDLLGVVRLLPKRQLPNRQHRNNLAK